MSISGTRRRLQALTVLGWSPAEIADRAGMNTEVIRRLRSNESSSPRYLDNARVLLVTRDRIVAVYDALWQTPSIGPKATRMRKLASRNEWLAPMDLDDDDLDVEMQINEMRDHFHIGNNEVTNGPHPATGPESSRSCGRPVDESVVDDLVAGLKPSAKPAELSAATRTLTDMGYTSNQIAERLGVAQRTVVRYRARTRSEAAA